MIPVPLILLSHRPLRLLGTTTAGLLAGAVWPRHPGRAASSPPCTGLATGKVVAERERDGVERPRERSNTPTLNHCLANTDKPRCRHTRQPPPLPKAATAALPLAPHRTESTVDERAAFCLL
ncbi:hypothetical protein E2C01_087742 [Portunus trituberculatus]|uniref:Uncharacterized protein n=1 Tax=Portunus trituberculatus TaxID=210409 RepID=A0A5B7J4B6_PORTR|nr:hypothetical protein [Portunus trituberculatus]